MLDDREQLEAGSHPVSGATQPQTQPGLARPTAGTDGGGQVGAAKPAGRSRMRVVAGVVGLLALGAGAWFGQSWWTTGRFMVSTDDAYVGARSSTLSPKVSGYIADVAVEDNAQVKAGDVIVRIDDGDYRLAVQTARDQVAVQQATIERLGKQVIAQQAGVEQAKAQLASAKAGADPHRARAEAPAGPGDAPDQQPACPRAGAGQQRPGRRGRAGRRGGRRSPRPPTSTC